jgi:hypothetical protein
MAQAERIVAELVGLVTLVEQTMDDVADALPRLLGSDHVWSSSR